jgi:hypothetical protein
MIAFPQKLPHVIWRQDRLVPLSEAWLVESINHAARRAGHEHWELTPHVARAVAHFLEEDEEASTLTVEQIQHIVRQSLKGIGYPDIAHASELLPPRVSISLPEIAAQTGCELVFYPMLKGRLHQAFAYEVRGIRLEGLRACVKMLDAAQKWRKTCDTLSSDIVVYARTVLSRTAHDGIELVVI